MTGPVPPPQPSELEQAVDTAVAGKLRFADWPEALKAEYQVHRGRIAQSELRFLQIVGLIVAVVSIAFDAIALPDQLLRGAILRLVLVVPIGLAAILFWDRLSVQQMKLATATTLILFAGIVAHLACHAEPVTAARYLMSTTFLLGAAILILPFRRRELVAFTVVYIAVMTLMSQWPHTHPPQGVLEQTLLSVLCAAGAYVVASRHIDLKTTNYLYSLRDRLTHRALEQNIRVLRELSDSDALTGLANRRSFSSVFASSFADPAQQGAGDVTVMMIDLDHFKRFNDDHGHQAGDRALRQVARCLEECFRGVDGLVARFGGEEFIGAFRSGSVAEAEKFGEMLRCRIAALDINVRSDTSETITTSIGLASTGAGASVDLAELTARADRALYSAKKAGRNRVVVSERIELRVDRIAS
ncbi:GGDEF domain-containing protein [Parerythrobacter jejuensis]|uniref:diguanylate cyclase n=1 Tax=Parerythrobacter jejuensis TaxID=795812 RepID=A0A845APU8_9SPHN|nr:GGDEF domain-containing protein [Parerythrobacter jejuensis]MXP31223.1 diguanylate cyclase [Parerythrobacter jejuensis]MXP33983.1 diguanylate cyclase [Parerythrobacter jejuensis]